MINPRIKSEKRLESESLLSNMYAQKVRPNNSSDSILSSEERFCGIYRIMPRLSCDICLLDIEHCYSPDAVESDYSHANADISWQGVNIDPHRNRLPNWEAVAELRLVVMSGKLSASGQPLYDECYDSSSQTTNTVLDTHHTQSYMHASVADKVLQVCCRAE